VAPLPVEAEPLSGAIVKRHNCQHRPAHGTWANGNCVYRADTAHRRGELGAHACNTADLLHQLIDGLEEQVRLIRTGYRRNALRLNDLSLTDLA
jgi:hypothetical protein